MTETKTGFNEQSAPEDKEYIYVTPSNDEDVAIRLNGATVQIPHDGTTLLEDVTLTIPKGAKVALVGPNGSGKTSLFRVSRGLWDQGSGTIEMSNTFNHANTLCTSQEIRKVPTTLPGIMAYPKPPETFSHEEYEAALEKVGLGQIKNHLPWHAVDPDNIVRLAQQFIDKYTSDLVGKISDDAAQAVLSSFNKRIHKKLALPTALHDQLDEEKRDAIIDAMTDYAAERLKPDTSTEDILMLLPSRAGRKIADRVAESTKYAADGWLLHGQRMRLSGGQQQMLAFARKFLQKPELMFIDEGTSDLKQAKAHELLDMLFTDLPDSTVIAIIHDDTLIQHFTHVLELTADKTLVLTPVSENDGQNAQNNNAPKP